MNMRIISAAIAAILVVFSISAHAQGDTQRKRWMKEMRESKMEYVVKQLELTKQQRAAFEGVYKAMENELDDLHSQTRMLVRNVEKKDDSATDLEYEKAAEVMFEEHLKEGEIETKYLKKYKEILTPKQLFKLRKAEMKFHRELMKHSRKNSHQNKSKK